MIYQFEPVMTKDYADRVHAQIMSGWVGSGKTVTEFENAFAEKVNRKYAIACTSGSAAILISLLALGLKPGTKVMVPNYSFPAALQVVRTLHLEPILVDIDPDTLCMSYEAFKEEIKENPDTKAIIYIPHNGYMPQDMLQIKGECNARAIYFIEDSACGLGCKSNFGTVCGTVGTLSTFSFSVPKLITTGQGGMIVTDNEYLATKCREVVDQGSTTWRKDGIHTHIGTNFKFTDIQAALGMAQLEILDELLRKRFKIMQKYIMNGVSLMSIQDLSSPWMMIIKTIHAHEIQLKMEMDGIQAKMYYKPAHYSYNPQNKKFPGAEKAYLETLYLPSSLSLTPEQIDMVCKHLKSI